ISRWMKRKGVATQKESQIFCGQFITKLARNTRVLTDDVIRSLSALIYCIDLDTTTLKELINCKSRLIPKDPQPGVLRVGIPRPPGASMQDLYDRMGCMEIRQEAIERMEYRQSYHRDSCNNKHLGEVDLIILKDTKKKLRQRNTEVGKLYETSIDTYVAFHTIPNHVITTG
ncbi:hypothetical protein Tco_0471909, partial [Tanacetum coccineum]